MKFKDKMEELEKVGIMDPTAAPSKEDVKTLKQAGIMLGVGIAGVVSAALAAGPKLVRGSVTAGKKGIDYTKEVAEAVALVHEKHKTKGVKE